MKMSKRLLVGHELFSRGNYAKIASLRFREKKREKKGNEIEVDLPILRNQQDSFPVLKIFQNQRKRFLSCFENLSPSFVLRDRDIIVYMTQRITFFCYFLPIEEKITEIEYIFVTLNLTNLRYL